MKDFCLPSGNKYSYQKYFMACANDGYFYGPNPQSNVPAWGCYDGCSSNCCIMNVPAIQSPPYAFLALQVGYGGNVCEEVWGIMCCGESNVGKIYVLY